MTGENQGWIASRFIRLSTGLKMLLILSLVLLPLGLIAALASIDSAQENRAERQNETRARVEIAAQHIDASLSRAALTISAASAAISATAADSGICESTLRRLARAQSSPGRYALYGDDNRIRCTTQGAAPPPILSNPDGSTVQVRLTADALQFALFGQGGRVEGTGEFSRSELADLANPGMGGRFDLALLQGQQSMLLIDGLQDGALVRNVVIERPVASGRLRLRITSGEAPITAAELLMVLLPVLMWAGAAIIGWLIVDRLLLRPLVRMEKAVSAYQPGDEALDLPSFATPAREIGQLGRAFDRVTRTVARHEAELEAAVERQTRLVREVHHRVKNNLQVVASLLNLHSRGSKNEDVAAAYASIQRRVDALAVVHRNHYAELEDNRGVALKPLISELAANLRANAPPVASHLVMRLDVDPYYVTQDVAVSVAFLITEMVEWVMFRGAAAITISLEESTSKTASLTVESDSLKGDLVGDEDGFERFDRIITGLSRQLRSSLTRDTVTGCYSLDIAVVEKAEH